VLKLVFMLIELLRRSDANVVNKDVTEHVLCWDCKVCKEEEEEEKKTVKSVKKKKKKKTVKSVKKKNVAKCCN
jgi:hypothetical protein